VVADQINPQSDSTAQRTSLPGWDRTRLGVLAPLGIVVAIAIVCIVVAALLSAHRADDVALDRERQLLVRAIGTQGNWTFGRLRNLTESTTSVSAEDIEQSPSLVQQRLSTWLNPLSDHSLVVVLNSQNEIAFTQRGRDPGDVQLSKAMFARLQSLADSIRGREPALPAGVIRAQERPEGSLLLVNLEGQLAILAAMPVHTPGANPSANFGANSGTKPSGQPSQMAAAPIVMVLRMIGPYTLNEIGKRLQLQDLTMVTRGDKPADYNSYEFVDDHNRSIARFAWLPQKPGAEILESVFPFIGIALSGFALLAGLVLRYMRHTAATITAGENRLRYLAMHDALCGLPNRASFSERLENVTADIRGGSQPAAVFCIDLDHFKDVNDTLGHPVGDELIRLVTMRLSRLMRGDDMVARLGGDEFAVITVAGADHTTLEGVAARMISALCAPYSIGGHTIVIGASIGIAVIDGDSATDGADIMRYADMALYRAKNEGRNRACIYDQAMDADLSLRKAIEQELRETIESGSLKVAYQPVFNASGDKIVGVEALARWTHPVRGVMSPEEFIPIAEYSGLIISLGEFVLRQACTDGLAWPGISVSVNVSPLQFRRLDFVNMVERILAETGFDPKRLELEITESTLLGNLDSAEDAMRRLKAIGVKLALDDFGTGYSSLLYLRRFPFDRLKIDRSFVLSIEKAPDAAAIVHAVVSLGRGLGMKVTAEGVETAEQHLFLRAAGVHCMQGYRFGRPMERGELSARLMVPGTYRSIEGDAKAALAS
jgi:diguanylate cyclase (GGDEF)-like protein